MGNNKDFVGVSWSFVKTNGAKVTNTCRFDCVLTVLFLLEQQLELEDKSLIHPLGNNHVLRRYLQHLKKGEDALAREVIFDQVVANANPVAPHNWWGGIGNRFCGFFSDIVGCTFVMEKTREGCGDMVEKRRHTPFH